MNWKKTLLICVFILLGAGAFTIIVFSTEPEAKLGGATKETAMLVEVTRVDRGIYQPTIVATGVVQPAEDIILSPRVSGEIVSRSPSFAPGGFVTKGEVLLKIDPADYENTLKMRKSDLHLALADLNIEKGRQDVARKDFQMIRNAVPEADSALVLRKPQLESAQARVEAARASVEQAALQLQRTTVKAPFDAHIITRNANIGSQVAAGENLGRIVGIDEYWIVVTVPVAQLSWISFPGPDRERGSPVKIKNRSSWPQGKYRNGYVYRLIGALENQTRMARILVTVPDPLAFKTDSTDVPPLIIGSFVETSILAKEIPDVIRLNRDFVRKNETVWVMEEDRLRIRDVNIVFQDSEAAYISNGLEGDDRVVTTNLSTVVDGAKLRVEATDNISITESDSQAEQNNDVRQTSGREQ